MFWRIFCIIRCCIYIYTILHILFVRSPKPRNNFIFNSKYICRLSMRGLLIISINMTCHIHFKWFNWSHLMHAWIIFIEFTHSLIICIVLTVFPGIQSLLSIAIQNIPIDYEIWKEIVTDNNATTITMLMSEIIKAALLSVRCE